MDVQFITDNEILVRVIKPCSTHIAGS